MESIIQQLMPFLFFVLVAIFIFIYIMSKQKERMALIEKGVHISQLNSKKYNHQVHLRNGILLTSLAIGLILGYIISDIVGIDTFLAFTVSILMSEGAGFLIYYNMNKNKDI